MLLKSDYMKLVPNIRAQIQSTHESNFDARAKYLNNLYTSASKKLLDTNDYLDIGCGFGVNSEFFGENFDHVYCSDFGKMSLLGCKKYMNRTENVSYIAADAQSLPFKDEYFNLVSAFSLIEHVPDQEQMLKEALRVLKKDGDLVMQFPNKHFFMELHSGIPFYCLIPGFARPWVSKKIRYSGLSEINIPSPKYVKKLIKKIDSAINVKVIKVIYPVESIPPNFRIFYNVLKKVGIFSIIPFGWMLICEK